MMNHEFEFDEVREFVDSRDLEILKERKIAIANGLGEKLDAAPGRPATAEDLKALFKAAQDEGYRVIKTPVCVRFTKRPARRRKRRGLGRTN